MKPDKTVIVKTADASAVKIFSPAGLVAMVIVVAALIVIVGSIVVFTDWDDSALFAPIVFLVIVAISLVLVAVALISSKKGEK